MFRVELLPDSSSVATPGYTYVADRGFNPAQAAMAPTLGRKRGIRDAGKGGDVSSRQANAIMRHLAELDRENQRDVQIPVPVKQAKEAGSRGTRAKTTSNVRRILQSQKTFRNHLDDEEAALAMGTGVGSGSGGGANVNAILQAKTGGAGGKTGKVAAAAGSGSSAAARRSSTPATASSSAARRKRPSAAAAATTTTATSTPTPAPSVSETADTHPEAETSPDNNNHNDEAADAEPKPKLIKTEHDNHPLLRSYAPSAPSDRIMQLLLAEPPLPYNAARAAPPSSSQPPRHFCCLCGYWGKIRCKTCHLRTCGLDCYKVHEDSRCGAFF
ncbi:Zinc finger HIT-type [Penicillium alfredii]|uniref:Zinc finger HIT-type n=1 Tax=Penicillium alfredii TaxID=1506179 RepID=A0A9W9EH34_9EURO|nr:Zinc finger HIT-type [Penicillium alfredii]KAJ5081605.1 Zinc finger HIT-type [Penicillium alfredii]